MWKYEIKDTSLQQYFFLGKSKLMKTSCKMSKSYHLPAKQLIEVNHFKQ